MRTRGQLEQAKILQFRLLELFDTMLYSADFPEGFRTGISLRGFDLGKSRQPLSEAQQQGIEALQRVLHCILADFGVVDTPAGGCPPGAPKVGREQVAKIAQQVLDDLRKQGTI